ncbi:hypothetical protein [Psychroserpens sp.]|uniref:hypothetical protein n=1 Tax=Psychroserpens sp. TaxID=2020870 RepID=UPI0039E5DFF4
MANIIGLLNSPVNKKWPSPTAPPNPEFPFASHGGGGWENIELAINKVKTIIILPLKP